MGAFHDRPGDGAGFVGGWAQLAYGEDMAQPLRAEDLLPLVEKLSHEEQVRLAKLALNAARDSSRDAAIYQQKPVRADEFSHDDDDGAWEGEGWGRPRVSPPSVR